MKRELERAIRRIERSDAWDEADEVVTLRVKRPLDKVVPVRLTSQKWDQLRLHAEELGVGPTTLARMWLMERLRSENAPQKRPRARVTKPRKSS